MMIKSLPNFSLNLDHFCSDFSKRFLSLLNFDFNTVDSIVALDMVDANLSSKTDEKKGFENRQCSLYFSPSDL